MRRSCCIAALVAIAYVAPGTSGLAEAGRRIAVISAGPCPERDAVVSALAQAMPDVTIVADAAEVPGDAEPVVVVSDGGASYRAVVRGVVRTLVDAPAHCEERARKVAIMTALALEPPLIAGPALDATETVATAAAAPSSGMGVRLETGGIVERAERDGVSLSPMGAAARLRIERDELGVVIGGTMVTWTLIGTEFVQRDAIDVAVRLQHRRSWIAGAVELGPSLVVQRTQNMSGQYRAIHLEAGLRLSGRIEVWPPGRDYGVFAAVTGTYAPYPAPLTGALAGLMPAWWLGASAGLVFKIQ